MIETRRLKNYVIFIETHYINNPDPVHTQQLDKILKIILVNPFKNGNEKEKIKN